MMSYYRKIHNLAKIPNHESGENNIIASTLYLLSAAIFVGLTVLLLHRVLTHDMDMISSLLVLYLCIMVSLIMLRRGFFNLAGSLLLWSFLAFLIYQGTIHDGFHDTSFYAIPGLLVIGGLVMQKRGFITLSVVSVLIIIVIGYFELNGILTNEFSTHTKFRDVIDIVVIFSISSLTAWFLSVKLRSSLATIQTGKEEIQTRSVELETSEQRFRSVFENSSLGIYRTTPDGKIILANPALLRMLGYSSMEELGTRNLEADGFEPSYPRSEFRRVMDEKNEIIGMETFWLKRDGSKISVRERAKTVRDASGNVLFYEGFVEDITERKIAEEALRESEQKFRNIVEQSSDGVTLTNEEGNILEWNHALESITGLLYTQVIGKPLWEVMVMILPAEKQIPQYSDMFRSSLQTVLRTGSVQQFKSGEVDFRRSTDGEHRFIRLTSFPIKTEKGYRIASIIHDVTDQKRADKILYTENKISQTLNGIYDLNEVLNVCLDAALETSEMDSGGIYLINESSRNLELMCHRGLSSEFLKTRSRYNVDTEQYRLIMHGEPLYFRRSERDNLLHESLDQEKINCLFVVPLHDAGSIIGVLNVASHSRQEIPEFGRSILSTIASQVGIAIAHSRATEKLLTSEERYRLLAENSSDIIWTMDLEGIVTYISPSVLLVLGYTVDEVINKPYTGLISLTSSRNVQQIFTEAKQAIVRGERVPAHVLEVEQCCKNGSRLWTEITANLVFDEHGIFKCVAGITRNIHKRKLSEDKFNKAFYLSPLAMSIQDSDGRFIDVNEAFERMVGYSKSEIINVSFDRATLWANSHQRSNIQKRFDIDGYLRDYEFEFRKKSGETGTGIMWADLIEIGGNAVTFSTVHDITERKRTEETIAKLEQAINSLNDVVFLTDRDGMFTFVNPEFTRLYGYTAEEVVGRVTPRILKSGVQGEEGYKILWQRLLNKDYVRGEFVNRTKRGQLVEIDGTAIPILDDKGNISGFLALQRDITERKLLEQQLYQAQKLDSIGTLVSGISHDFNNILNNIVGFAGQLRKYAHDPARVQRYSETVEKSAVRGSELAMQLLSLARRSKAEKENLDLIPIIDEVALLCSETFPPNITIEKILPPQVSTIKGLHNELYQAVLNICLNARDAMPEGGKLIFQVKQCSFERPYPVYLNSFHDRNVQTYVEISISDTGSGIPENIRDRIFDPFFTTKERGQGTGLGLAVVYNIIRNHEGVIRLESEINVGTTFFIYLPVISSALAVNGKANMLPGKKENEALILLVDDEDDMRELGSELLEEVGYRVITAKDGLEALDHYRLHAKDINLVILDLLMPKMDGGRAYIEMKKINPRIKAFFCTGYASDDVITGLLKEEKLRALQKPLRPKDFLQTVKEVLQEN
jgi:two-component system, cell cycle sensor histidine kinase and response regulator CckA